MSGFTDLLMDLIKFRPRYSINLRSVRSPFDIALLDQAQ